jgi:uncharacterized repeat protein (TIGR03803 family)
MRFRTLIFARVVGGPKRERDGRSGMRGVCDLTDWRLIEKILRTAIYCLLLLTHHAFGQVLYQPVYSTAGSNPSYSPFLGLTEGNDGNFYGMRYEYQAFQTNSILFRVTPGGTFTKLATLSSGRPATVLHGSLLLAADGNFYGATPYGGTFQKGVIFRFNGSTVSPLYSFDGGSAGLPSYSLIQASDGFLYGVTTGPSAIYSATTNGVVTILTNFPTSNWPIDGLGEGPDGWLYVTTVYSDHSGTGNPLGEVGRIYKFSPTEGFKTLRVFTGPIFGDYVRPKASPVNGNDGFLYGPVGHDDLSSTNYGTIYRMTTDGVMTNVFTFSYTNGSTPVSRLLLASDGNFYGITSEGGPWGYGTIFKMTNSGALTTVVNLNRTNAMEPRSALDSVAPLIEARNGIVYGTTPFLIPPVSTGQRVFRLVERPVLQFAASIEEPGIVSWNSFSGAVYQISYKTSVDATDWVALVSSFTATSRVSSCSDDLVGVEQRFYRVTLLP